VFGTHRTARAVPKRSVEKRTRVAFRERHGSRSARATRSSALGLIVASSSAWLTNAAGDARAELWRRLGSPGSREGLVWLLICAGAGWAACSEVSGVLGTARPAASAASPAAVTVAPASEPGPRGAGEPSGVSAGAAGHAAATAPHPDYEQADLALDNDLVVAPPEPIEDCEGRLAQAQIDFRPAQLPFKKERSSRAGREEVVACGAEQVVLYLGGPARIRYNSPPTLTCRLALALARFEQLAQEQALAHLGERIDRFKHLGTYSCRKMVRFDFVSEHSYANAIDIEEVALASGTRISVRKDFGSLANPPHTGASEFLRTLARRAYDERLFSTVLTPYWDNLHSDHFHLDLARYRVDGTRPGDVASSDRSSD
jgi:hypothetical protein